MHLRAKPWATDWLAAHSDIVITQGRATEQIGQWQKLFAKAQPIHVEIGSGKGRQHRGSRYPQRKAEI